MKYLKRINEGWSDDYVTDFSDNNFEIEETPSTIKGRYKGRFVLSNLNNWFTEMTDKLSIEYKVLSTKTFFNEVTGNANFEVEVTETDLESINVSVNGTDIEFIPRTIYNIYSSMLSSELDDVTKHISILIKGRTSTGQNKTLLISLDWKDNGSYKKIHFFFGQKSRSITMTKENIEKIFTLLDSGQVSFSSELVYSDYHHGEALRKITKLRSKISELM